MEVFTVFIVSVASGVIVAIAGYFLNLNSLNRERQARRKEQLLSAAHSILSELKTNIEIASQPFQGRLLPFINTMFTVHVGEIGRLPTNVRDNIYQAYFQVNMGNAIVQTDLQKIAWGGGYLDNSYKQQCQEVITKGKIAQESLELWMKEEGQ